MQFCRFDLEQEKFSVDIRVLQDIEMTREAIGWPGDWEKELNRKNCPIVKAKFLPSTTISHLSKIMVKCSLSMKETASFNVVKVVVGSSLECVLMKM